MVRGIDKFREHFREYSDQFVLIGGTACDLIMNEAGLTFRATKDLDIVLCVEVLNSSFIQVFWKFIRSGKYEIMEKETGEKQFYRFLKPEDEEYPYMLELFSRVPDTLDIPEGVRLAPMPVEDALSSLSVILMNTPYYEFLHSGAMEIDGIPIVGAEHLIPLKANAWLDLKKRREDGEEIDSKKIKKHKNDIFRLYRVIDPEKKIDIPETISKDMSAFLEAMEGEDVDLKNLGVKGQSKESIIEELRRMYVLDL